jgi:glutamate synthase domain-containing protein 1
VYKEGYKGLRIPSGCAISGIFSKSGERFSGEKIIKSIAIMRERSNGLGGGFAAYGIYPEYKELYAFHVFYDGDKSKLECEEYIHSHEENTLNKGCAPHLALFRKAALFKA